MGHFLPFYLPNSPKNQNLKKKWKKILEISPFYICVPTIMIRWCTVPEIWCLNDGQRDRQMEKVTYRGGCPIQKLQKLVCLIHLVMENTIYLCHGILYACYMYCFRDENYLFKKIFCLIIINNLLLTLQKVLMVKINLHQILTPSLKRFPFVKFLIPPNRSEPP